MFMFDIVPFTLELTVSVKQLVLEGRPESSVKECNCAQSSEHDVHNQLIEQRIEEANNLIERVMGALHDIKKGIIQYKTCGENLDDRLTDCLKQLFSKEELPDKDTSCCKSSFSGSRSPVGSRSPKTSQQLGGKFKCKTTSDLDQLVKSNNNNNSCCSKSGERLNNQCNIQEINDCNTLDLESLAILQAKLNSISDSSDCITTCSSKKLGDNSYELENNALDVPGCSRCGMYIQELIKQTQNEAHSCACQNACHINCKSNQRKSSLKNNTADQLVKFSKQSCNSCNLITTPKASPINKTCCPPPENYNKYSGLTTQCCTLPYPQQNSPTKNKAEVAYGLQTQKCCTLPYPQQNNTLKNQTCCTLPYPQHNSSTTKNKAEVLCGLTTQQCCPLPYPQQNSGTSKNKAEVGCGVQCMTDSIIPSNNHDDCDRYAEVLNKLPKACGSCRSEEPTPVPSKLFYGRPKETYVSPYHLLSFSQQENQHCNNAQRNNTTVRMSIPISCDAAVQTQSNSCNKSQTAQSCAVQTTDDIGVCTTNNANEIEYITPKSSKCNSGKTKTEVCPVQEKQPKTSSKKCCINVPEEKSERVLNLCVQNLPAITIKGRLTIQNVLNMSIRPTGSMDILVQDKSNIKYEEVCDGKLSGCRPIEEQIEEQPVRECDTLKSMVCLKQQLKQRCDKIKERKQAAEKTCSRTEHQSCNEGSCQYRNAAPPTSPPPHGNVRIMDQKADAELGAFSMVLDKPTESEDSSSVESFMPMSKSEQMYRTKERNELYESYQILEEDRYTGGKKLSIRMSRSKVHSVDLSIMDVDVYQTFIDQNLLREDGGEESTTHKNQIVQCDSFSFTSDITGESVSLEGREVRGIPDGASKKPDPAGVYQIIPGPYKPIASVSVCTSASEITKEENDEMLQASFSSTDLTSSSSRPKTKRITEKDISQYKHPTLLDRQKSMVYYEGMTLPIVSKTHSLTTVEEDNLSENTKMVSGIVLGNKKSTHKAIMNVEVQHKVDLQDAYIGSDKIMKSSSKSSTSSNIVKECHPKYVPLRDIRVPSLNKRGVKYLGRNYTLKSIGGRKQLLRSGNSYNDYHSLSEGEVDCNSSISNGEVCKCHKTFSEKDPMLKNLKREFCTKNIKICREKNLYKNWVTYYVHQQNAANEVDEDSSSPDNTNTFSSKNNTHSTV